MPAPGPTIASSVTVTVTAAQISADAITNGGSLPEQDFVLAIYNAQIAAPVLQSVSVANKIVTLTWNLMTNFSYRVQYKTNLTDPNWITLPPDISATNTPISVTNAAGNNQRFYHIGVLQ